MKRFITPSSSNARIFLSFFKIMTSPNATDLRFGTCSFSHFHNIQKQYESGCRSFHCNKLHSQSESNDDLNFGSRRSHMETKLLKVFEFGLGKNHVQALPEYFMKFHTGQHVEHHNYYRPLIARGHLVVTHGNNWFNRLLAKIGGLPKENLKGAEVTVTVDEEQGVWKRKFDGREMNSKWEIWKSRNESDESYVVESFGPFAFGFKLNPIYGKLTEEIDQNATSNKSDEIQQQEQHIIGFEHSFRKMWFFNVPVPAMLALDPSGKSVCVNSRSWYVEVNISNPLIGTICSYKGIMTAEKM
ncbi:hypothetical protein C9374_005826 [Naegleria lovaniensis]|uniref:DUF4166 domain-containing protein n=1 Tax=Naegleria lovaniensis TaxID=51637 RepID=A0AA88GJB6_NAELO|nr:uncharacterized protein C9374_005826 [Naegleria lovaniensis]KAG2382034.1 hypothetical protein C9374_005826 [Naegleria lovaniensis]